MDDVELAVEREKAPVRSFLVKVRNEPKTLLTKIGGVLTSFGPILVGLAAVYAGHQQSLADLDQRRDSQNKDFNEHAAVQRRAVNVDVLHKLITALGQVDGSLTDLQRVPVDISTGILIKPNLAKFRSAEDALNSALPESFLTFDKPLLDVIDKITDHESKIDSDLSDEKKITQDILSDDATIFGNDVNDLIYYSRPLLNLHDEPDFVTLYENNKVAAADAEKPAAISRSKGRRARSGHKTRPQ